MSAGRWLLAVFLLSSTLAAHAAALPAGLKSIVAAKVPDGEPVRAVAMLDHLPTAVDVAALGAFGLTVQPLTHLPMVLTKGPVSALLQAHALGRVRDFYPDRPLEWHSAESTAAMSADITRGLGFDGRGVGVAIVDSGIDASHPILASRVVRNVRVYSPDYGSVTGVGDWPSSPALVIPFDELPYNNTDTIGHGTHVAGIAAGDGTDNPELIGVAPGASVIGYSTGEVLFIFTALASFDDILATHEQYNIRVVNNSWGSSYRLFDPNDPINVASKALHDAGIAVVFSAGNDGVEMSTNPHSAAPWVIMSGSATVSKEKSDFSSSGLMFDNTQPLAADETGYVHFDGDGLGLSPPDASAPGSDIVSSGTPTGVTTTPGTPPGGSATASGTSMSAPHMSGLAAVLLSANPDLTPDQIRQVMEVTSVPMRDGAAFWQSGHGFVDAKQAVDLVTRADFSQSLLDGLQLEAQSRALAARPYRVLRSDHWTFDVVGGTVFGLDTRSFPIEVGADAEAIRASVAFPADLGVVGLNLLFDWSLALLDPDGNVVAESERVSGAGVSVLHADFDELGIAPKAGTWTVEAVGNVHLAEPALLWGGTVTVQATQLIGQEAAGVGGPSFAPTGQMALRFAAGVGELVSPEGCSYAPAGAAGSLATAETEPDADCHAGTVGYAVNYGLDVPAEFVSEPLAEAVTLGGAGMLKLWLVDTLQPLWSNAFGSGLTYQLDAVDDAGETLVAISGGDIGAPIVGAEPTLGEYALAVPPTEIPAGARLRLRTRISGVYTSTMRLLWGGDFADTGLQLTTGKLDSGGGGGSGGSGSDGDEGRFGGALGRWLLAALGLA
ncbi:MAG: S8 family serine peptidase, partial [Gammaproteobacteria bacterium]